MTKTVEFNGCDRRKLQIHPQFLLVNVFRLVVLVLARYQAKASYPIRCGQTQFGKHIVRGRCLQTFLYSFDSVPVSFLHAKTNGVPQYACCEANSSITPVGQHLEKQCTSQRIVVLDQSANTLDREWLIVLDNEFHYLGINGFRL